MNDVQIRAVSKFVKGAHIRIQREVDFEHPSLQLPRDVYPICPINEIKAHAYEPTTFHIDLALSKQIFGAASTQIQFHAPSFCRCTDKDVMREYLDKYDTAPPEYMPYTRWSMATRFLKELFNWLLYSGEYRSDEQIKELHTICSSCPFYEKYDEKEGACSICGCGIKAEGRKMNKLAWKSTRCPHKAIRWF